MTKSCTDTMMNNHNSWITFITVLEGDQEDTFAHYHWMIDNGCTDHLSLFEDDFVHLGTQTRYATVANGQQVSTHGSGKVVVQQRIKGKILPILTL